MCRRMFRGSVRGVALSVGHPNTESDTKMSSWWAIARADTGALLSIETNPAPRSGVTMHEIGAVAPTGEWDPVMRAFGPNVPPAHEIPIVDFRERFTFAERASIKKASRTDDTVAVLMEDVGARSTVKLNDPRTIAGVHMLRDKGIITAERADAILAV